jgi:hypothetical protein
VSISAPVLASRIVIPERRAAVAGCREHGAIRTECQRVDDVSAEPVVGVPALFDELEIGRARDLG